MKQANRLRKQRAERALDRIDFGILAALSNDARRSNKELAAEVGLAPSSCLARVRRLIATGVLRAFRAEVDPAAFGLGLEALIKVRLARHSKALHTSLKRWLLTRPEVVETYYLAGADDFLVHVLVKDAEHLRQLVTDGLGRRKEIGTFETSLVFEHLRGRGFAGRAP